MMGLKSSVYNYPFFIDLNSGTDRVNNAIYNKSSHDFLVPIASLIKIEIVALHFERLQQFKYNLSLCVLSRRISKYFVLDRFVEYTNKNQYYYNFSPHNYYHCS